MRTAQVFSFIRQRAPRDWSTQDVAEFYRVEAALIQAGLRVSSARGLTDEGEPWFVFCRSDDDEIIIHFARIDGRYVISAPAYCGNATGYDFRTLVRDTIERHPVMRAKPTGGNLFLHPAALLVMLVATAFLKAGSAAEAAPTHGTATDAAGEAKTPRGVVPATAPGTITLDATQETLLLSAISAAIMTPMPVHTVIAAPSPALPLADVFDPQHGLSGSAMLLDKSGDAPATGLKETSLVASPQTGIMVTTVETAANAPAHMASLSGDTLAFRLGGPDATHILSPPDGLSFAAVMSPVDAAVNPVANVQLVSLSGLSDIPQADKMLLQALGVSDTVAYASVTPAALSSVIHANAHTTAVNTHTDAASGQAQFASSLAASHAIADAGSAPVSTMIPGLVAPVIPALATGPDISAVLTIVQQFQAIEVQPAVLLSAHGAIFYDAYEISTNYSAVKSVTYDFGDGFSISLVGIPAELTHAGAHV